MANRNKILEKFSSKFKSQRRFEDEIENGHKKRRPNWESERRRKQAQWEEEDER